MQALYLRVGALLLGGVALLAAMVVYFGSAQIRHGRTYETYFRESVQGLDVGAPVKYRGVSLGQVTEIGLVSAEYGGDVSDDLRQSTFRTVLVRFQIDPARLGRAPSTEAAVREGLRARLAPQGLTGGSYVELDFAALPDRVAPLDVPWVPRADYIPSIPSTLNEVTDKAKSLLSRIDAVDIGALATNVTALSADLRHELEDGDAKALLTAATQTLRVARDALAAADLPGLAAELRRTSEAARALAQNPQTTGLLRSAGVAAERLATATARLPALLDTLETTLRRADSGSADVEAALAPLLRDVRATVSALRETTDAARRDPAGALLGGPPPRARP